MQGLRAIRRDGICKSIKSRHTEIIAMGDYRKSVQGSTHRFTAARNATSIVEQVLVALVGQRLEEGDERIDALIVKSRSAFELLE